MITIGPERAGNNCRTASWSENSRNLSNREPDIRSLWQARPELFQGGYAFLERFLACGGVVPGPQPCGGGGSREVREMREQKKVPGLGFVLYNATLTRASVGVPQQGAMVAAVDQLYLGSMTLFAAP